jgi:hypothetical protein
MATRNSGYSVGAIPPQVTWTVVRGDTAAFKIYLTDDAQAPIYIPDWTIDMEIKRPTDVANAGVITDAADSALLETGDIFDVELSTAQNAKVWTVAQGKIVVVEDVTN